MERGDPEEYEAGVPAEFRVPPPVDDRLWRHPSEVVQHDPPMREATSGWVVAIVSGLVGSVLTFGLVAASGALGDRTPREEAVREFVTPVVPAGDSAVSDRVVQIAETVSPAITRIEVAGERPGSGSGVVFRDDGYLLTNAHVVAGARSINVVLADGSEHAGQLVGADTVTDVAVVKIEGAGPFSTVTLGSAAALRVGQPTVAIGSPLGLIGGSSVTTGVVSALGRRVPTAEGPPLLDMIQTDAAIAPGSSGGALLDGTGAVIGITTAIALSDVGAEGLGFATPIDIARSVADDIITTGSAVHVWLGIEGRDLDAASAKEAGVPGGAVVVSILDDGPAAAAGLRADDVIVAVADQDVRSMSALVIALREQAPGDRIDLDLLREGRRESLTVELGVRPPAAAG